MTFNVDFFKEKGIKFIQFQFTTALGELKSVEFPAEIWPEMQRGTGVDGSSLGFLSTEQSDMRVKPDLDTFAILPWEPTVGRFICDMLDNNGNPHPTCPRGILKRSVAKAKKMGYEYKTRPELEWFFIDEDGLPSDDGEYMDTVPLDVYGYLRRLIAEDMMDMGMGVKTIHHECGYGQQEIEFTPDDALIHGDNTQTSKIVAKTESAFEGIICSFMAKPFPDQAGSGLHVHQYLTKNGENIFSDKEKGISDLLRYFVGGILKYVDEMTAFFNPTTNSYKRLVPGHEAPVHKAWGIGNRTALIRVPGYEDDARVEYRAADCSANIYLVQALLLEAGLEGIKNKIEPIAPTIKNVERMTKQERDKLGIVQLPKSLEEAIEYLEQSDFVKNAIGKDIVDLFIANKKIELEEYKKMRKQGEEQELEWELTKYLLRS